MLRWPPHLLGAASTGCCTCLALHLARSVARPLTAWSVQSHACSSTIFSCCHAQSCGASQLLTAEQEAWLGELVQAGRTAQQQLDAAPTSGNSGSAPLWRQRASGPPEPLELAMQRGAAAQQLLFDTNLRLVAVARRKLLGSGRFLQPQLLQVRM